MTQPVGSDKSEETEYQDIDWNKVASRVTAPKSTSVQTGELPLKNYILLVAAAQASNDSLRAKSKSLLNAQVITAEIDLLKDIEFYASNKGLSIEDAIVELVSSNC